MAVALLSAEGWIRRRRRPLPRTNTLDMAIAPAAKAGESRVPLTGRSKPASTGTRLALKLGRPLAKIKSVLK